MSARYLLAFSLVTLTGCQATTAASEPDSLTQARARWEAHNLGSYRFEMSRTCVCVLGGRRMEVTVHAGSVSAAADLDNNNSVEAALLTYVTTIPDLFDLIEDALGRKAAYFSAMYDPILGYPTRIDIDYSATTADDELTITVRDLAVLESAAP
ncbi:MAG: hypothetical protein HOP28_10675 [Gemmatimonadales bacterium]|nr:hypothetical protein [Gemmatimonadales bacterium]